jgi:hypothetical protein
MKKSILTLLSFLSITSAFAVSLDSTNAELYKCSYYYEDYSQIFKVFNSDWLASKEEAKKEAKAKCDEDIGNGWYTCSFKSCRVSKLESGI